MKIKKFLSAVVVMATLLPISASADSQLAFPGAEGWGRWALGARGVSAPTVYHVTNLNDSGTGSLRDAVSKSGRIIVFDVSGVIRISSRMTFAPNIYIAGQTAPGEGITVYGNGVSFSAASNIICRYLRVRMGHGGDSGKDCAGVSNGTNMIFDHCSFSWGLDETFSINPDGKGDIGNITLQNCIIGQGLMTHSAGGLIQADNITLYRNLYCDNSTRNNKIKGINQYANNIVYNWKDGAYIMGGDSQGKSYTNIQSNLFINGPAGGGNAFTGANADFHCYGDDNWQDKNHDGIFSPSLVTDYSASTRETTPYNYPSLPLYKGNELLTKLLPTVGASLPYRDQSDCYMVDEVMSYGAEGALITYESSLPIGTPSDWAWWKGNTVADTDGDGMPDWWEDANGTNRNSNDACVKASNGYLNIENYINSITVEDRQYFLRRPVTLTQDNATTSTITIRWRDYTYEEEGFAVEILKDGTWSEVKRSGANTTTCTITDLEPGTTYKVRMRAFAQHNGAETFSDYSSTVSITTRPLEIGVIDIDTYEPDVTNSTDVAEGKKLLLNANAGETLDYALSNSIAPSSVVVTGKGTVKISGSAITGDATSMNMSHEGKLILSNTNSYKGATVTHGGVVEFASIANGGVNSSIGASASFAQNWIFDGGTYRYTGGNASTDRSMRLDRDATFDISSAALTMSGKLEGKGTFTLDGNGTMNIADADFFAYDGALRVKGSNLNFTDTESGVNKIAGSDRKIILAGGRISFAYKNEDFKTFTFPIEVEEGTHSYLSMPSHCYFRPVITGNGTLQFDLPYVRAYLRPNLTNFSGRLIGNGTKSGALFYNETTWNAPNATFELKGGITLASWSTEAYNIIGGLAGDAGTFLAGTSKQTKGFKCTWEVGGADTDETFSGVINNLPAGGSSAYSGTVSIIKVGNGIWRLNGANVYSGTTSVNAGTLIVNGTNSGTGAVTVSSGATLMGKGSIAGTVTLENGATIRPGDDLTNLSTLTIKNTAEFKTGSTLVIPIIIDNNGAIVNNKISVSGDIRVAAGARLEIDLSEAPNYKFKRSDVFEVIKNSANIKSYSGEFTVYPATPGEGFEWDTSTLFSDGKLRIKNEGEQTDYKPVVNHFYNATLDHTAHRKGGANNPETGFDLNEHAYNNWGTVSWVGQAYAQFSFDIPAEEEITKAEFSVYANAARVNPLRNFDIYCMPAGSARIDSESAIPELTGIGNNIEVARYTAVVNTSYAKYTGDATNVMKAMHKAGQKYIIFIMSNGAAGGSLYGKAASSTYVPKLTINTTYDPNTGVKDFVATPSEDVIYDLSGRKIAKNSMKHGIYIVNGKKAIIQ